MDSTKYTVHLIWPHLKHWGHWFLNYSRGKLALTEVRILCSGSQWRREKFMLPARISGGLSNLVLNVYQARHGLTAQIREKQSGEQWKGRETRGGERFGTGSRCPDPRALARRPGRRAAPSERSEAGPGGWRAARGPGARRPRCPPPARPEGAAARARPLSPRVPPLAAPAPLPIWSGDTLTSEPLRSPLPRAARPPGAADGAAQPSRA
ncbi:uncharacterized protein C11orf96-like [Nycticebus coucang]|uniref:uncharacterized protein C11orf96-like n=1 Tax=Nycticebus coucang TaxID=9470 RepID=UPI00234DE25C|nr:uncharacterized protein C11orf96-like [Nycticebus coucang]